MRPDKYISNVITNSLAWQYRTLLVAALAAVVGLTLAVAGALLVALAVVAESVFAIVGSAAMLALGIVLTIAVYLWLTL